MTDERLIIAFKQPPAGFGFKKPRNGRSWILKAPSLEVAKTIAEQLQLLKIRGVIKRITERSKTRERQPRWSSR